LLLALALSGLVSALCGFAAFLMPDVPCRSPGQAGFAWPSRAMLRLCAMAAMSFAIEGSTADWSGVYLRTELGTSAALASMGLAAFAAAMVAGRLAATWPCAGCGADTAWIGRTRHMSRDHEHRIETSKMLLHAAAARMILERLAK